MDNNICFTKRDFTIYMYLLVLLLTYISYVLYQKKQENMSLFDYTYKLSETDMTQTIKKLQQQLHDSQLNEQRCKQDLSNIKAVVGGGSTMTGIGIDANRAALKLYNPLVSPERVYQNPLTQQLQNYQMIGYLYKDSERLPLFGRYKYPGRTEKWEYYIMDETRNHLKIPFKTVNDNEISDGDVLNIPTLGSGYTAKIYEYETLRYNPNF